MWATWVISPHLDGILVSMYSASKLGFLPNYSHAKDPVAGAHLECVVWFFGFSNDVMVGVP